MLLNIPHGAKSLSNLTNQNKSMSFVQSYSMVVCCPAVTSGAFCCEVVLDPKLDSWTPSEVNDYETTKTTKLLQTLRNIFSSG